MHLLAENFDSVFSGVIAQLVERLLCKQDVRSSSLLTSTDYQNPHLQSLEYELVWIVI